MRQNGINNSSIIVTRGGLTAAYRLGWNHARAFVCPMPPADAQGSWLYMNGYQDSAAAGVVATGDDHE